jgi:hypothetical protein
VTTHDFANGGSAGWSAGRGGLENAGNFAEEVGAEEARSENGEGLCRSRVEVIETVNGSAMDEDGIARAALHCFAIDREAKDALEPVGRLFVGIVAVGDGDLGSGGDLKLEHGDGASGVLGLDEVADREAADADLFADGCSHGLSCGSLFGVRVILSCEDLRQRENAPLIA